MTICAKLANDLFSQKIIDFIDSQDRSADPLERSIKSILSNNRQCRADQPYTSVNMQIFNKLKNK